MTLKDWLSGEVQEWPGDAAALPEVLQGESLTRLTVLAALLYMKNIGDYGLIVIGGGRLYGREGLNRAEWEALVELKCITDGFLLACDRSESDIVELLAGEIKRIEKKFQESL